MQAGLCDALQQHVLPLLDVVAVASLARAHPQLGRTCATAPAATWERISQRSLACTPPAPAASLRRAHAAALRLPRGAGRVRRVALSPGEYPVASPDGRWIVFCGAFGLRVVGARRRTCAWLRSLHDVADFHWGDDSASVVLRCVQPARFEVYGAPTRRRRYVHPVPGAGWAPGGEACIDPTGTYAALTEAVGDVAIVDLGTQQVVRRIGGAQQGPRGHELRWTPGGQYLWVRASAADAGATLYARAHGFAPALTLTACAAPHFAPTGGWALCEAAVGKHTCINLTTLAQRTFTLAGTFDTACWHPDGIHVTLERDDSPDAAVASPAPGAGAGAGAAAAGGDPGAGAAAAASGDPGAGAAAAGGDPGAGAPGAAPGGDPAEAAVTLHVGTLERGGALIHSRAHLFDSAAIQLPAAPAGSRASGPYQAPSGQLAVWLSATGAPCVGAPGRGPRLPVLAAGGVAVAGPCTAVHWCPWPLAPHMVALVTADESVLLADARRARVVRTLSSRALARRWPRTHPGWEDSGREGLEVHWSPDHATLIVSRYGAFDMVQMGACGEGARARCIAGLS